MLLSGELKVDMISVFYPRVFQMDTPTQTLASLNLECLNVASPLRNPVRLRGKMLLKGLK